MNIENALLSLNGLSIGDAFGEKFFVMNPAQQVNSRLIPTGIWTWTDDTHMALSIVENLIEHGCIEQNSLVKKFSARLINDKRLGYGAGTRKLLEQINIGGDWRILNKKIFPGGSFGNGAAMRVAPIGGFFPGDLDRSFYEAKLSAEVTHAHPEGAAGAVAVAVAASLASNPNFPEGYEFIKEIIEFVPEGLTKDGIRRSLDISPSAKIEDVVHILGNGGDVSAQDTIPFCIWCASYHLNSFKEALWTTVSGLGDRDTTCAIVGGIVALSAKAIPDDWLKQREPFPNDFLNYLTRFV